MRCEIGYKVGLEDNCHFNDRTFYLGTNRASFLSVEVDPPLRSCNLSNGKQEQTSYSLYNMIFYECSGIEFYWKYSLNASEFSV